MRIPRNGFEAHPDNIKQTLHIDDPDFAGDDYGRRMYQAQWDLYVASWRAALSAPARGLGAPPAARNP